MLYFIVGVKSLLPSGQMSVRVQLHIDFTRWCFQVTWRLLLWNNIEHTVVNQVRVNAGRFLRVWLCFKGWVTFTPSWRQTQWRWRGLTNLRLTIRHSHPLHSEIAQECVGDKICRIFNSTLKCSALAHFLLPCTSEGIVHCTLWPSVYQGLLFNSWAQVRCTAASFTL